MTQMAGLLVTRTLSHVRSRCGRRDARPADIVENCVLLKHGCAIANQVDGDSRGYRAVTPQNRKDDVLAVELVRDDFADDVMPSLGL